MKKIILGLFVVTLFGCSKEVVKPTPTNPIVITPTTPVELPKFVYYGKTSYELKIPNQFINVDSLRTQLGIINKGIFKGTNNLGYVYVDMNNDGLEDIFYPYSSDGKYQMKPDVMINKGGYYVLDNSMLPTDFIGTILTRKTLVGDFNNDSLPDLFLVNSGWDEAPFSGEQSTLLLSDKTTNKYKLGDISMIPVAYWHGGASGDLNGDGNLDMIITGGMSTKILYGNGKGNFTIETYKYVPGWGNYTTEIVDVDKDGKNDIIVTGSEVSGSKSLILWNRNNNLFEQTLICEQDNSGWGTVVDIVCNDLDGDGTNEIILDRTGDNTTIWYGGYNLKVYKSTDMYKTFKNADLITANLVKTQVIGNWITKLFFYRDKSGLNTIRADVSSCYVYTDYRKNPFIKIWVQNQTTKQFE